MAVICENPPSLPIQNSGHAVFTADNIHKPASGIIALISGKACSRVSRMGTKPAA